ncbi:MAG: MFS transporter [Clostridia bacterium]|nr:MFS transporter [Clostridia bacterium]
MKKNTHDLKQFYILWSTQSLSQLGSSLTSFSLTLWLYQASGSALKTAALSVCSYAPYVLMSIFAGALSDRWDKKKTMLVCDAVAACCTVIIFALLRSGSLQPWHLYVLNALDGLMNTVQNPASEVAVTMITPKERYQQTGGLRAFSRSLNTILHPVLATALYSFAGMNVVIAADLITFFVAFFSLLFLIKIPGAPADGEKNESVLAAARDGLQCLRQHRLVLWLILFLAGVNFVASAFDAALPAFILPRENGGSIVLGWITTSSGLAMLAGSLLATALPAPKNRVRVIVLTMAFSLTIENLLMPLIRFPVFWCLAQVMGYLPVPLMNTNLDVIVRSSIPENMQGRVYSCRNTLQFFTIPLGLLLGGWMVDGVFEPFMAAPAGAPLRVLFGTGKGAGAGLMIFLLGLLGGAICLIFGRILKGYRA